MSLEKLNSNQEGSSPQEQDVAVNSIVICPLDCEESRLFGWHFGWKVKHSQGFQNEKGLNINK